MNVSDVAWVERHRPETLDEIKGHTKIVERMEDWVDDPQMPNVMLAGPQGTGKTALVVAFAREKYGDDWRNNVLQLNASDERGIDVVRERIKNFARAGSVGDHSYTIVFLDEVDSMTNDAQAALRRVMEDYADQTRFFLSCNYPNKIIDPVQSRCAVFRLNGLDQKDIEDLIVEVAAAEGIDIEDDVAIELIARDARGDARKAITMLQSATMNDKLDEKGARQMASVIDDQVVEEIIKLAASGDLEKAFEKLTVDVLKKGVSEQKFIESALRTVKYMDIPEDSRAKIIGHLGDVDERIVRGSNPHVQLHAFLSKVMVARHLSLPNYSEDE